MQIGGIGTSGAATLSRKRHDAATAEPHAEPGRALVPVQPPVAGERSAAIVRRPMAAFLAHLIATEKQVPQTRLRRRAEPEHAVTIYVGISERTAAPGRILRRST